MSDRVSERTLELTVNGEDYIVVVEIGWQYEDDSFDHDWGGRTQTEVCGHWEAEDHEVISVVRLTDESEEEVDVSSVKGLSAAIAEAVSEETYEDS